MKRKLIAILLAVFTAFACVPAFASTIPTDCASV